MRRKWFGDGLGLDAMLPDVRRGVLEAAERRLRFEVPWLRPTRNATALAGVFLLFGAGLDTSGLAPLVAAAGAASLVTAVLLDVRFRRVQRRLAVEVLDDPRRCLSCNYPLAGLIGGVCPECGTPFGGATSAEEV